MNTITMKLQADHLIMEALREDISSEDVTTNSVMKEAVQGEVDLICKQDGIIAGLPVFQRVFELLDEKYHEAFEKKIGIYGSSYTNTMMVELGVTLHFAAGSDKNIKLTTKDDLEMFKAYLHLDKANWLK